MEVIRNMDTKECPNCGSRNIQTLSNWLGCFNCQYQKLYSKDEITPMKIEFFNGGKILIYEQDMPSRTLRGTNTFNEMK